MRAAASTTASPRGNATDDDDGGTRRQRTHSDVERGDGPSSSATAAVGCDPSSSALTRHNLDQGPPVPSACPFCRIAIASTDHRVPSRPFEAQPLCCSHCLRVGCATCVSVPVSAPTVGPWCGECPLAPNVTRGCPGLQLVPRRVDEFDDDRACWALLRGGPAAVAGGSFGETPDKLATSFTPSSSPSRLTRQSSATLSRVQPVVRRSRAVTVTSGALPQLPEIAGHVDPFVGGTHGSFAGGGASSPSPSPARQRMVASSSCAVAGDAGGSRSRQRSGSSVAVNSRQRELRTRLNDLTVGFFDLALRTAATDTKRLVERGLDSVDRDPSVSVVRRIETVDAVQGFLRCSACYATYGTVIKRRQQCACCLAFVCSGCAIRRQQVGRHAWKPFTVTLCPGCKDRAASTASNQPTGGDTAAMSRSGSSVWSPLMAASSSSTRLAATSSTAVSSSRRGEDVVPTKASSHGPQAKPGERANGPTNSLVAPPPDAHRDQPSVAAASAPGECASSPVLAAGNAAAVVSTADEGRGESNTTAPMHVTDEPDADAAVPVVEEGDDEGNNGSGLSGSFGSFGQPPLAAPPGRQRAATLPVG